MLCHRAGANFRGICPVGRNAPWVQSSKRRCVGRIWHKQKALAPSGRPSSATLGCSPSLALTRIFQLVWSDLGFTKTRILRRRASPFYKVRIMAAIHEHGQEKRKRERFNVRYPVTIKSSQGLISGETKNISPSGALIVCACGGPILPPETLALTIKRASHSSIETSARVVWSNVRGFRQNSLICWIGVRFTG